MKEGKEKRKVAEEKVKKAFYMCVSISFMTG